MKDIEALKDEFRILPVEKIIGRHFVNESTSGMQMRNMLALELYVSKYRFTTINSWNQCVYFNKLSRKDLSPRCVECSYDKVSDNSSKFLAILLILIWYSLRTSSEKSGSSSSFMNSSSDIVPSASNSELSVDEPSASMSKNSLRSIDSWNVNKRNVL